MNRILAIINFVFSPRRKSVLKNAKKTRMSLGARPSRSQTSTWKLLLADETSALPSIFQHTLTLGAILFISIIVILPGCKQQAADINAIAHPVHTDSFMAKRMETEIMDFRRQKDEQFKKSADSPLPPDVKVAFTGLEYYPIDWKFRFEGPVHRYPTPEKISMITTSGVQRDAVKYGYIRFVLTGKEFKLEVYRLLDLAEKNILFVPFIDMNVGKETYPAGRYIDLIEKDNGMYVIDFNMAYNPACAYGGTFPCPVTPAENRLAVAVPAGEKILSLAAKMVKEKAST